MKQRFAQFMIGRNGVDYFSRFLTYFSLVLLILNIFIGGKLGKLIWLIVLVLIVYNYYRMFSRNLSKRRAENAKYMQMRIKVVNSFTDRKERYSQRKDYCFFKCPSCKAMLRVPRGKGRIRLTCRKCGTAFERKT